MAELLLGVNIDHIATVRNARGTQYPDPVQAAFVAEQAGADGITVHLREDRRHITDRDVALLNETIQTRMNLEMAVTDEMIDIACRIKPTFCCLVPEKREEVTTEGGLDVAGQKQKVAYAIKRLSEAGILVSLFIDADHTQIDAAQECGAPFIEIHTGCMVKEGKIKRSNKIRLIRDGIVIYSGDLGSLKRFKDDVKEVSTGYECGLNIHNYSDIKVGDIIEAFEQIEIKKTL